jgi:hypothetical protein
MLRIPHFPGNRLTDSSEVVSLECCPHFTLQKHFLILISLTGEVNPGAIMQLEAFGKQENSMTSW